MMRFACSSAISCIIVCRRCFWFWGTVLQQLVPYLQVGKVHPEYLLPCLLRLGGWYSTTDKGGWVLLVWHLHKNSCIKAGRGYANQFMVFHNSYQTSFLVASHVYWLVLGCDHIFQSKAAPPPKKQTSKATFRSKIALKSRRTKEKESRQGEQYPW